MIKIYHPPQLTDEEFEALLDHALRCESAVEDHEPSRIPMYVFFVSGLLGLAAFVESLARLLV